MYTTSKYLQYILICLVVLFSVSCRSPKRAVTQLTRTEIPAGMKGQHPEYFMGITPCADCSGIRMDLFLGTGISPNGGHFELHETYLGKGDKAFVSKGNWAYINSKEYPGLKIVQLFSDKETKDQRFFLRLKNDQLKMLTNDMKTIESDLNYILELENQQD